MLPYNGGVVGVNWVLQGVRESILRCYRLLWYIVSRLVQGDRHNVNNKKVPTMPVGVITGHDRPVAIILPFVRLVVVSKLYSQYADRSAVL